jgi:hypothetical protein
MPAPVPSWLPPAVAAMADTIAAAAEANAARLRREGELLKLDPLHRLLHRLTTDPRMATVWRELKKHKPVRSQAEMQTWLVPETLLETIAYVFATLECPVFRSGLSDTEAAMQLTLWLMCSVPIPQA